MPRMYDKARLPFAFLLLSTTALSPASANCTFAGKNETCSGQMHGAAVHTQNDVTGFTLFDMNNPLDAADSADASKRSGPAIFLRDPGGTTPQPSGWNDDNRNGQNGINAAAGSDMSATISLDNGHAVRGPSGITIQSNGWTGSNGHASKHFDKTANGGAGGDGGTGGSITFLAQKAKGTANPAPVSAGSNANTSTGLDFRSYGGAGGTGGTGDSTGGLRDSKGGTGGTGGLGGNVNASLKDGHFLAYDGAGIGMVLVSAGGRSGNGGRAQVDAIDGDSAYGGHGGQAGNGGAITLDAASALSNIKTTGSNGIALASDGGSGGKGGNASGGHSYAGAGGDAGDGGAVSANLWANVSTSGDSGAAVYLRSAGGFAGDSGSDSGGIVNHSGRPGDPGAASAVSLTLAGKGAAARIQTSGTSADGIFLQSIGGMGSRGGTSSGFVSYGAKGGSGGAGGNVAADLANIAVSTSGDHSNAFLAQSIGGGGGKASKATGLVALGSAAGAGGWAGDVTANLHGAASFSTKGVNAAGVLIQSIGGGGGHSGDDGGLVALGGKAGLGGDGGKVALTGNQVTVSTTGNNSVGVMVSSIGAGGGNAHSEKGPFAFGGTGGGGSNGNGVSITSLGDANGQTGGFSIATSGDHSDAVVLQSIGGGGGKAAGTFVGLDVIAPVLGAAGGDGGKGGQVVFTGSSSDVLATTGALARGILAQSIGGGGGTGGNTTTINVGAKFNSRQFGSTGADGQDGGTVQVNSAGTISTKGNSSTAVLAQSIGGGGAAAGNHIQAGVSLEFNHDLGGAGGAGGTGGAVTVANSATITTQGADADGILAQSVGGGGGQSSSVVDLNAGVNLNQFVGVGGATAGNGGTSSNVSVTTTGVSGRFNSIQTKGDQSMGILAQSVSGGGGKAGSTITGTLGNSLGGVTFGQGGGTSGSVDVSNSQLIWTSGKLSSAIVAQSVSGGGGQSGATINGNVGASVSYTHGASGGKGGTAGTARAANQGSLTTFGDGATAMVVQSIAGGGGNGGIAVSGAIGAASVNIGVGSKGGDGGPAGSVTATNSGEIATRGNNATAISLSSIAGAGGNAGLLANGTGSGGQYSAAANVAVGGSGGKGGTANAAKVTNSGTISTTGFSSTGIFAQSIGGSGGTGGAVYAGTLNVSSEASASVTVAIGGKGGDGGKAGAVTVANSGRINTSGHQSDGILLQSIGGNGGVGGGSGSFGATATASTGSSLTSNVQVGGKGGSGAVAGAVTLTNTQAISTSGGNSNGIYAQSVGGNGGKGALGVAMIGDFAREKSKYFQMTANTEVGGYGGTGNHAGAVTVTNSGDIRTQQNTSIGIFAQSVGGGGGDGGNAGAYTVGYTQTPKDKEGETAEGKELSLSFTMGGSGGGGGHGGAVSVSNLADTTIQTAGTASYGIFAQSVGGSGGTGGNGEPGLEGWVADIYDVYEKLKSVKETYAQIKELREHWLSGFSVNIGGGAGDASNGEAVNISNAGTIITGGASATAIYAQSIGGGGGTGGDGTQGTLLSVAVAGNSGGGGNGGAITISSSGTISTAGSGAMGIHAQSVGGGGGNGGEVEGGFVNQIENLWETLGAQVFKNAGIQSGGTGGSGGNVSVTVSGAITTKVAEAHGVFAQSVGGGGGAAQELGAGSETASKVRIGGEGRNGDGGFVSVTVPGTITVTGTGAAGVIAQSVGGKESESHGVSVSVAGKISAQGAQGRAILVQAHELGTDNHTSEKSSGISQVTIQNTGKVEVTDAKAYEAIAFLRGREVIDGNKQITVSNILTNYGEIYSPVTALRTDGQSAFRVDNYGKLFGRIGLNSTNNEASAQNQIVNQIGGQLNIGDSNLGENSASTLTNHGTMKPGWLNDPRTVTVTSGGSFNQSAIGTMKFDARIGDDTKAGKFLLEFDSGGHLDGTLAANWLGTTAMAQGQSGQLSVLELKTKSGHAFDTSSLGVPTGGAVHYTLKPGAASATSQQFDLGYQVDYSGDAAGGGIASNERTFGTHFARTLAAIEAAGTTGAMTSPAAKAALHALGMRALNAGSSDELSAIYDEHVVNEAASTALRAHAASGALHNLLQSCPTLNPADPDGFYRQQDCVWMQALGGVSHQNATGSQAAFDETVTGLAAAAQAEVIDHLFVELGAQYENVNVDGSTFKQDGQRYGAGLAVKREIGAFTLSGSFAGGVYSFDNTRRYTGETGIETANATIDGRFLSAEARLTALFERGGLYARPGIALSLTQLWQDGYTETGTGGLNWQVDGFQDTAITLRPSLEVGKAFNWAGMSSVVYARADLGMRLNGTSVDMTSRHASLGGNLTDLDLSVDGDRFDSTLALGVKTEVSDRLSFSLQGQAALSESSYGFGGSARMQLRF